MRPKLPDQTAEIAAREAAQVADRVMDRMPGPGLLVRGVAMPATGSVTFAHRLGRKPDGLMLADVTGGAAVWYRTAWDDRTITLASRSACVAAFWVY